jgi:hypothetical protein
MIQPASKDWIQQAFVREFGNKLLPTDFYWEDGKRVMTESYHTRRGSCCGSGCRHCPYNPKHVKGTTNIFISK